MSEVVSINSQMESNAAGPFTGTAPDVAFTSGCQDVQSSSPDVPPPCRPWTAEEVAKRIETDDLFVPCAVLLLYQRQEIEERDWKTTIFRNSLGFDKIDGSVFSGIAGRIRKSGTITVSDLAVCRSVLKSGTRRLARYRVQIAS